MCMSVCSAHLCERINFVPYSPMFLRPVGDKTWVKRVCRGGVPLASLMMSDVLQLGMLTAPKVASY